MFVGEIFMRATNYFTLSVLVLGMSSGIYAKEEPKGRACDRVAVVPGNGNHQRPNREPSKETHEEIKVAKKKKKKDKEKEKKDRKEVLAENALDALREKASASRQEPKEKNARVAVVPGKASRDDVKQVKEKKSCASIHQAAQTVIRPKITTIRHNPPPVVRPVISRVVKEEQRIAIVPNISPQIMPQPAEYPIQVVNAEIHTPVRPIVISRPLPQTIVIDRRSAAYPYAALAPWAISPKGDFVQLEDGSRWKVRHRHYKTAKSWNATDVILIETGKFFTWSAYKLVNYTRGEFVDVDLIEPTRNGTLSHWIAEIDVRKGYLRLQDGSTWYMSASELLNWNLNDDVMIALSKDWFSGHSSYVLINPRAKTRLFAILSIGSSL